MRKVFFLLSAVLTLSLVSVQATTYPGPCEFKLTGEWSYLHPLIDDPYYVISSSSSLNREQLGSRNANPLSFESAFRVEGMYGFKNCHDSVRVSWLHLDTNHLDQIAAPNLRPTQGYSDQFDASFEPGEAQSKIGFTFNQVEAVIGHGFDEHCCMWDFHFEGGIHFVDLEQKSFLFYDDTDNANKDATFKTKGTYWGVGPQIGLDIDYNVSECFSFVGRTSGGLLIGENSVKNIAIDDVNDLNVNIKNQKIWRLVPVLQARVGLNYSFSACWNWCLEGGYQFITYQKALSNIQWPSSTDPAFSFDIYTNADFHGPYVSLSATF